MKKSECVVGARVICVSPSAFYGRIGTITVIKYQGAAIDLYHIFDDSGREIGVGWRYLDSWDIYTGLTKFPMTGFKICQRSNSREECPCGIYRGDCEYHNGKD